MRDAKKQERHAAISQAAYALLAEKGYGGTSMLSIAKAAKASNETLYRWYGDKRGLFEAMVRDNAAETEILLTQAIENQDDPLKALKEISPIFLKMLLGEKAILLNRAAAADPTQELGAAISAGGRDTIQPLFGRLIAALVPDQPTNIGELVKTYVSLLIGDSQIKRAIGVLPEPSAADIDAQCALALRQFQKLL